MNIRKIKIFSFATILATVAFVACKDDFSEQEFLQLQSDLKIKQDSVKLLQQFKTLGVESEEQAQSFTAALNDAGDLLQVTLLVREDNKPVGDVQVTLSGASAPATTNASGIAIFDRVRIGESTIQISKAGYTTATALVTFGTPASPVPTTVTISGVGSVTRYIAPAKRFENIGLPIFSLSGEGSTARLRGIVTYEKDLTNDAPEIPVGLVIQANLRDVLLTPANGGSTPTSSNTGQSEVLSYQFSEGTLGVATVAADGNYEMRVPATVAGLTGITLTIPQIVENQTAVVAKVDNGIGGLMNLTTGPERRTDILTKWTSTGTASPTLEVPSVKIFFPEPPTPGQGYNPTFTRVARAIDLGTYGATNNQQTVGHTTIAIQNRGSEYSSAPTVGFSGTGTEAEARLRGYISHIEVTSGGTGYPANTNVFLEITETLDNGTVQRLDAMNRLQVTTTNTGSLPVAEIVLPAANGYQLTNPFETSAGITGMGIRVMDGNGFLPAVITPVTAATIVVSRHTELHAIVITEAGEYSEKPTVTISGGGSTTQASAIVSEYRVQWASSLLTSTAVANPYKVVPAGFNFAFPSTAVSGALTVSGANIDVLGNLGNLITDNISLKSILTTDGTNLVINATNAGRTFVTDQYWDAAPKLIIQTQAVEKASGDLSISSTGQITAASSLDQGVGYDEATMLGIELRPVYEGAPGTGGVVTFTPTVNAATKEVTALQGTVANAGSNYRENANRPSQDPLVDPLPAVKTGQTYKVDIKLGTGTRITKVDGFN